MKTYLTILVSLICCNSALAEIKTQTVNMPMRDGIKLDTDVYCDDAVFQAPVILMRTPYDRTKQKANAE